MNRHTKFKETEIGMIPQDWEVINGKDCLMLDIGSRPKGGIKDKEGIPSLGGEHVDLATQRINFFRSPKYISKEYYNRIKGGKLAINDILINKDGAYTSKIAFVWELFEKDIAINEHLYIIRNQGQFNQKFLFYYLVSKWGQYQIKQNITGSAQPGLNTQFIKNIFLPLPRIEEQNKIASILSSFDERINIIQKQNKTLEAIGQALFKHWFIDFEFPNEEGKPYKSSGGEMVDSELGEIPKGWKVGKYEDVVTVSTGKGLNREGFIENGAYPVLGANGELGRTDKYLVDEKLILTGRVGTLGTVYLSRGKVWISDNVLISKPLDDENYYYAYFIIKTFNFESLNRGSTQPLVTQTDLKNQKIVVPDTSVLKKFHNLTSLLFDRRSQNIDKNNNLAAIRDLLLSKLMLGKIRVPLKEKDND